MSAPSPINRPIVLVGLMGAGKTTIGRRLAPRLGLAFVDADSEIEAAAGCSIPDIFALHGEPAFRDLERRVIARLLGSPPRVIATGGGAFINPEVRRSIADCGISIWLRADLEVLLKRVARRPGRPLIDGRDRRQALKQLIDVRYPVYAEADIIVDTAEEPHEAMIDRVQAALHGYLAKHSHHPAEQPR